MKVTVDISEELYRSIKVEAARSDRSVRELVAEALDRWLEAREDDEDRRSAGAAMAEYQRDGGVSAADYFRTLAAEAQVAYGGEDHASED